MHENPAAALLAHAWEIGWNQGDTEAFREFFAPGYVRHSYAGDADIDLVCQHIREMHAAFPDISINFDDIVADGGSVAVRWTATASHKGDFLSIPPTYRPVEVAGMTFSKISEGRFIEEWATWSPGEMLRHLRIISICPTNDERPGLESHG